MDRSWPNEPAGEEQKRSADKLGTEHSPDIMREEPRDLFHPQRRWYAIGLRQLLMWAAVMAVLLACLMLQPGLWCEIALLFCWIVVVAVLDRVAGPFRTALGIGLLIGCLYVAGVVLGLQPRPELGGKCPPDAVVSGVLAMVNAFVLFVCGFAASLAVSLVARIIRLVDDLVGRKVKGGVRSRG